MNNAKCSVNLPGKFGKVIQIALESEVTDNSYLIPCYIRILKSSNPKKTVFDAAQNHILQMLSQDSYRRFQLSPIYKEMTEQLTLLLSLLNPAKFSESQEQVRAEPSDPFSYHRKSVISKFKAISSDSQKWVSQPSVESISRFLDFRSKEFACSKLVCSVDCSAEEMCKILSNMSLMPKWDPSCKSLREMQRADESTVVVHVDWKFSKKGVKFKVKKASSSLLFHHASDAHGNWALMFKSVASISPESPRKVPKLDVQVGAYIVLPVSDEICKVTHFFCLSPSGSVPLEECHKIVAERWLPLFNLKVKFSKFEK